MKKILSFLLIFCVVFSSLVGTGMTYVSASYATSDDGKKVYTFDTETGGSTKLFDIGEWYLSNGTDSVKFGSMADNVENMGMNFKKIELSAGTLNNIGNSNYTLSIRGEINKTSNYGTSYTQGDCGTEILTVAGMNAVIGAVDSDEDGTVDRASGKVAKYTMYAYSELNDGEPINFNMVRAADNYSTVFTVPANVLYSKNSIPHKIDLIFYHQSGLETPVSSTVISANWVEIYIDGLFYAEGNTSTEEISNTSRFVFVSPNINFVPDENNTVTWKNSKLYICSSPSGKTSYKNVDDVANRNTKGADVTAHSRDEINSHLFQNVYFGSDSGDFRNDFVTGVAPIVANSLEVAYTDELGADRVIKVDNDIYENPSLIWNGEETNVSIVDKNGNVYGAEDSISGTFADYYIAVNGVYAKVEESPVSFDISAKTVVLNPEFLPDGTESLQIIVAAFDNNKLSKIKASESFSVGTSDITFEINDNDFPINAEQYKVFVFESLANGKPLVENIEINNK